MFPLNEVDEGLSQISIKVDSNKPLTTCDVSSPRETFTFRKTSHFDPSYRIQKIVDYIYQKNIKKSSVYGPALKTLILKLCVLSNGTTKSCSVVW